MTAKLYVRDGGTEAASVIDVSEFAPSFEGKQPLIELGMSFQNGAASQGTFRTNPTGIFGTPGGVIAPHAQVTWTEDASGDELWLARGRTSGEEEGRGIALAEDIVEHVVTVDDANVDTRGLAFTEDWVRPAETDTARLYALDAYILSGASSTSPTLRYSTDITASGSHLAPNTETVTMPAKTYPAGTQPSEVINDCAESASKVWGVVIHHTGGTSHLCLLYIKELDHSTFASACKISDQVANWDPEDLTAPVFEPIWDQGKGLVFGAQSAVSGILNRYGNGDQFIYVNNPTLEDQNEHWIDSFSDSDSVTATQAEARANAILSYRSFGDFTYRASVIVLPEQTHLLGAGMSLGVDTAVFPGGTFRGDYENVRIVQLTWEPIPDGRYFAHMQLNRTLRTLAPSRGKVQPSATTPESAPECLPDTIISPTTIWSWQFTTDNEDDATSTYAIGLERTASGGFGDYPPANAAFGSFYGRNNAGAFLSQDIPISASTLYGFRMDILWRYTPSNRNVDIRWHDAGSNLLRTDRWISGSGHAVDTEYNKTNTFTSPVGAVTCQIYFTNFAGLFGDNIFIETPGSVVAADNDPFCVVGGAGDSPYYAKSDDPRFDSMEQQIADLESSAVNVNVSHLLTATTFPIVAHRGDVNPTDGYPENTLEAVRQAATRGAHGVEFDVLRDSEGTWHLMHDTTVDDTTDGTGTVASKTTAQMAALNINGGFGYDAGRHGTSLNVPTLDDVVAALKPYDVAIWFHCKETADAGYTALAEYIVAADLIERSVVLADTATGPTAVKAVAPHLQTEIVSVVLEDVENEPDIDRLLAHTDDLVSAAYVIARNPKPVDQWIDIETEYGNDETTLLTQGWERGARSSLTHDLEAALAWRNEVVLDIATGPTGAAGGDLSGTYPNPSVVDDSHSHTSATSPGGGGPLLVSDDHSTPIIFADLLLTEEGDDLLYADSW